MAKLDELIAQIKDDDLRERLLVEAAGLGKEKKFGLVFEDHIPECTPLYGIPIKKGSFVAVKGKDIRDIYLVASIKSGVAKCSHKDTGEMAQFQIAEIVRVAQFGEAIFPHLESIDKVENAPDSDIWHTLIEADNYHALQLLEYLYPKQVDCIYIDPPYNTGARDWKYNNDYVDSNDAWRHSKWLSMMKKRLLIAKRILKPDTGVLICAIDDYEISHLLPLLEEIYPSYIINTVIVNHHPQGGGGDNVSRTHEYALFLTPEGRNLLKGNMRSGIEEQWSLVRSGTDVRNYRSGRPNQFYALYVDTSTYEIKGVGRRLSRDDSYLDSDTPEGCKAIYPISKKDGSERVWRYERQTMVELIERGEILCTPNFSLKVIKKRDVKYDVIFSLWAESKYNAGVNGSDLLRLTVGNNSFAYPKSLYTVQDAVRFSTGSNPNALIVDFFAGSGTTLHAVNLLNAEDGGKRRCILVTNNEVSETEAKQLKEIGLQPGDREWEKHGIAESVTWPRTKYSIMGKRDDGTELIGEYFTSLTQEKSVRRSFSQIGFTNIHQLDTSAKKKQLVALMGKDKLAQSLVQADSRYIVSEKHSASILFDDTAVEEWLKALEDQDHIAEFYVVTQNSSLFNGIKDKIQELLGDIIVQEPVKLPMSAGFKTNAEYFKLGFLDKHNVALGRQFREIVPLLWLKSGAKGKRPEIKGNRVPVMFMPVGSNFAVLTEEIHFDKFQPELDKRPDIEHVYLVTDSEVAFREMAPKANRQHVYQLYRDYLDNFVINSTQV
ncbi:MAG: site-specific DNA-methyltransferase [Holophagaceae bacterium]|nr:site-specific DNA-methyltransferase [Holophagaceae bacterium]